jgi:alpha-L-arabinofuranosidase
LLLQVFYSVRSERLLVEQIDYNLLFRWFVGLQEGSMNAIAMASADGRRMVIKALNYSLRRNVLLVRLQGESLPQRADVKLYTIAAQQNATASMEHPDAFAPGSRSMEYARNFSVAMDPYSVAVVEIRAE